MKQCNPAATGYVTCGDANSDGCTEWSNVVDCAGGQTCSNGQCASECSDECDGDGMVQCLGNAVQTCGDYSDDGCLQWGTPAACGSTQICADGACGDVPVPGNLWINEVLYDDEGSDKSAFVELYGEPGLDLSGFVLTGVNGTNGQDYNTIALEGSVGGDGYFVVAKAGSAQAILDAADQLNDSADYQNGPDSIVIRWGGKVVDAVGYGSFGAAIFAGEGSAAVDVKEAHSLGRDNKSTDTNDNATDFVQYAIQTPGAVNGAGNKAPVAKISCPADGKTDELLSFDAAGSSDEDGSIVKYTFSWGDSFESSGPVASAGHKYAKPGSFDVTLTVTDDGGATGTAGCTVVVGDANSPVVILTKPLADLQVTQGTVLTGITADVTPAPGRSITKTELVIDGVVVGAPDTLAPYSFGYTVPEAAVTDSVQKLQVRATDNEGGVGISSVIQLFVKNDKPVASFTAVISGNLQVTVDASGSSDTETPTAQLQVRYDWENDGVWDTAWSTDKKATYTYPADGDHVIKMEVKDDVAQVSSATRTVNFASVQDVSGTVTTTLWYGTINITGDTTVPAGETLTIAPGTTVVVLEFDQANDGTGDFDLTINGTLKSEGTAAEPVIITTFDTDGKNNASSWNRITLNGSGHLLEHTIIEYADIGLAINGGTTLANVELRKNRQAMFLTNATLAATDVLVKDSESDGVRSTNSKINATSFSAIDNGGSGVVFTGGTGSTFDDCTIETNGMHGVEVTNANVSFDECSFQDNARVGVYYRGSASGDLFKSVLRNNGFESVRSHHLAGKNPTPKITYNNIFENGSKGSMAKKTVNLSAASSYSSTSSVTSATQAVGLGRWHLLVKASYSESPNYSGLSGAVIAGTGSKMKSFSTNASAAWHDVSTYKAQSVRARAIDTYKYGSCTTTVSDVLHNDGPAGKQLTTFSTGSTVVARFNYFGVWPDVLSAVTYENANYLDIEGFVATPFDETFSVGNTIGGYTITADTTWDSDVFITGSIAVGNGATLTIDPGVTVTFVPTDQDNNKVGDWWLDRKGGTLNVGLATGALTTFDVLGVVPASGGFQFIGGGGGGASTFENTLIQDGFDCLRANGGSTTLTSVTTKDCANYGAFQSSSGSLTTSDVDILNSGKHGIYVTGSGKLTLNTTTITDSKLFGVGLVSATNAGNTVKNSTITNNVVGGALLQGSKVALSNSNLKFNGYGVQILGGTSGSVNANNIQSNNKEGVFAGRSGTAQPTITVTGNNIFGNSIVHNAAIKTLNLAAASSYSSTSSVTSSAWNVPDGLDVLYFKASYSESPNYSGLSGAILGGNTTIKSFSTNAGSAWYDTTAGKYTSLKARANDTYKYGSCTTTLQGAVYNQKSTSDVEMTAMLVSKKLTATGNYWGVTVPTSTQARELLPATIDFTQFKTTPIAGTGPQ